MGEAHIKFVCLVESRDRRTRTSVQGLDSSAIGHCAFLRGVAAFVCYLSVSGGFVFIFLAFSLRGKFLSICSLFWNV